MPPAANPSLSKTNVQKITPKQPIRVRRPSREEALQAQLPEVSESFEGARARGDYGELYVYAGQAVGLIRDLPAADELVRRLVAEAEAVLLKSRQLLTDPGTADGEIT